MGKPLVVPIPSKKTVFIRNLPHSTTNESLLDVFKVHGPIQNCFVVTDAITKKSRGIGYIKYTDSDDAATAVKSVRIIEGRKVFLSLADAKKLGDKKPSDSRSSKPVAPSAHRLIVRNLPFNTDEAKLRSFFAGMGGVSAVEIPTGSDGKSKGYGFVFMEEQESGEKAISDLSNKELNDRKVSISWFLKQSEFNQSKKTVKGAEQPASPVKPSTTESHKLIIRNLPFKISADDLKKSLTKYGDVTHVDIPLSQDGQKRGFSFVTFGSMESATQVVSQLKEISGRPVAVDWAVDKSAYLSKLSKPAGNVKAAAGNIAAATTVNSTASKISDSKTSPAKSAQTLSKGKSKSKADSNAQVSTSKDTKTISKRDTKGVAGPDVDGESGSEDGLDNELGDNSESEIDDESEGEVNSESADAESADAVSDESDSEEEEESDEEESEDRKPVESKKGTARPDHKTSSADVSQDRTLFLRNVGYATTEDQLTEVFAQFGEVSYVKLLMDPMTERSKGMAFVQYKSKVQAELCLEATEDSEQKSLFFVDGRDLNVALAVTRERITELNKSKEKQPKDKRNLYLAREGMVRAGTKSADGVSTLDMNRRTKLETMMRAKLKNPLIFISTTRLCVHNLPTKLTDKQLRAICLKAAEQGKAAKVVECRIMRDLTNVNADGVGKSRGYGFVDFSEHQHALAALRSLNNNPDTFTNEKRPIVEFSLENTKALQAKEKRLQSTTALLSGNTKNTTKKDKATKIATKGTDSQIERPKGVKPGLPSHHGPKVRHNPRPSTAIDPKKEAKLMRKRKVMAASRREKEESKQPKPKKRRVVESDSFDKLVASYRNKMSGGMMDKAKAKWYE